MVCSKLEKAFLLQAERKEQADGMPNIILHSKDYIE
jgi:hypothetical protein